jgi:serine/threonine protein kinase
MSASIKSNQSKAKNNELEEIKTKFAPLFKDLNCKIKEILGQGGYSYVLKIELPNNHLVAIKVFKSILDIDKDKEGKDKIKKELLISKSIRNEYFVNTLSNLEIKKDNKIYFGQLMEMSLFSLNYLIKILQYKFFIHKPYPSSQRNNFFWLYDLSESFMKFFIRQIIFAFEFLKINKLIHLDFKPENILIGSNFHINKKNK